MRRFLRTMAFVVLAVGTGFGASVITGATEPASASVVAGLPPIPDSIPSQLGWVRVHIVPNLKCNEEPAYGCFYGPTRMLEIRDSMDLSESWQSLEHERVHMILLDGHAQLPESVEDHVADVIGAARVTQMLAELAGQR